MKIPKMFTSLDFLKGTLTGALLALIVSDKLNALYYFTAVAIIIWAFIKVIELVIKLENTGGE